MTHHGESMYLDKMVNIINQERKDEEEGARA